jgi:hypothetical protein
MNALAATAADSDSFRAGVLVGRLLGLLLTPLVPVFLLATIYWVVQRARQHPISFGRALTKRWVLIAGGLIGLLLLVGGLLGPAVETMQRQAALEAESTAAPSPSLPPGWATERLVGAGFEVGLPTTWVRVRTNAQSFAGDVRAAEASNLELGGIMRELQRTFAAKGVALIAAAPQPISGVYPTLLVTKGDVGTGASLDSLARGFVAGFEERANHSTPISRQDVRLPAGKAVRLEARVQSPGVSVTQVSYLLLRGAKGKATAYGLILMAATDQASTSQPLFQQVADSFRFVGS